MVTKMSLFMLGILLIGVSASEAYRIYTSGYTECVETVGHGLYYMCWVGISFILSVGLFAVHEAIAQVFS